MVDQQFSSPQPVYWVCMINYHRNTLISNEIMYRKY